MADSVKKTFSLPVELYQKLEVLQKEKSFSTITATLQYCIIEAYEQHMRNEKRFKKLGDGDEKLDIDERRREREVERCKKIAERLEGELVQAGDGFNVVYYTHSKHGSYRQVVPLLGLTEELVGKQWFPSREVIEEYWKLNGKPGKKV